MGTSPVTAFSFMTLEEDEVEDRPIADDPLTSMADVSMLTTPEGEAIVDTATAQNLIGEEELEDLLPRLEELGMLRRAPRRAPAAARTAARSPAARRRPSPCTRAPRCSTPWGPS